MSENKNKTSSKIWQLELANKNMELEISARKEIERSLKDREDRFKTIFFKAPVVYFLCDINGTFIDGNIAAFYLTGYTKEELFGKDFISLNLIDKKDIKAISDLIMRSGKGEYTGPDEFTIKKKDRTSAVIELSTSPVTIGGKKQILGVAYDITKRKLTETQLQASEERFRKLFESAHDALMTLDPLTWKFTSGNPALLKMFNVKSIEEFLTYGPWDVSPQKQPDGRLSLEKAKEMIELAINKGSNYFEWTHKRINGEPFPATVLLTKIELNNETFIQATVRDITKQKKAEDEIRENEQKYRELVENANDGITIIQDGKVVFVNNYLADLYGQPPLRIIDKPFTNFVHPESLEMVIDRYKKRTLGKTVPTKYRVTLVNNKKEKVFSELNVSQTSFKGKPAEQIIIHNITDDIAKEKALIKSEKKYRDLFEKSKDAILIIQNGKFIDCNETTIQMLRYKSKNEFLNTHPSVLSPEYQPDGKLSFEKAEEMMSLAIKDGSHRFEWDHKRADGEVFPVEVLLTAIALDEENIILHTVWRDITERKQAELKLRQSEERFKRLFDDLGDAVYVTKHGGADRGQILEVNRAAVRQTGYSRNELLQMNIIKDLYISGSSTLKSADWEEKLTKGESVHTSEKKRKKNGEEFWTDVIMTSLQFKGKNALLSINHDVTKRKKIEKEIQINAYQRGKLLDISRELSSSLDLKFILKKVNQLMLELLDSKGATIYMIDAEKQFLVPQATRDPGYEKEVLSQKVSIKSSLGGKVVKSKKGTIFNNASQIPGAYQIPGTSEDDDEHLMILPLLKREEIFGTLNVYRKDKIYLQEDLELAETFAIHASTAIQNAQANQSLIHEINERKRGEIALQLSEKKYRTLTENLPIGIFRNTPGPKGKFIEINQACLDMFRFKDRKSMLEYSVADLYASPSTRKKYSDKLNSQGFLKNEEQRLLRRDGTTFIGSTTAIAVKDKNGKVIHHDGIIEDITERVELRMQLKENEEKFRAILYNSPDIIMQVDWQGTISFINYNYAGLEPEKIIGKTIFDLMPSEFHEIAQNTLRKVFETGKSFSYENLGLSTDDSVIWYKNNVSALKKNGKVIAATIIASDISDIKQTDIMKTEFISSVSHELRTPLTIIRESLSLLSDGIFGKLTKEQADIVDPCMEDVDRLARIINNLLDISKIEGQKITIDREMADIVKIARGVVASFVNKVASKKLELIVSPSSESINLYLDTDRIVQVFMNLIGNAVKFTDQGKIEVIIIEKENIVECCVADTGRGIERKDLGTVFDRFHQVGKIVRAGEKGTGLGLSISKGIVKLHHGKIWVNSKENKGSKFYFTLPKYSPDEIIIENIEKGIDVATKKHIKLSLLLVRIDNFAEIETKLGLEHANNITKEILKAFQDILAPGEFSFIKGRNEIVLFSDITEQNIRILVARLKDMLSKSLLKFDQETGILLSFGYSIYPSDAKSASDLIEAAYKTLKKQNK